MNDTGGHVNEQDQAYVAHKFLKLGYTRHSGLSMKLRMASSLWWFKKSIYVFEKI